MFVFDDVELSGPLPLLLNKTAVPETTFSVVAAAAVDANTSTTTPVAASNEEMLTRRIPTPLYRHRHEARRRPDPMPAAQTCPPTWRSRNRPARRLRPRLTAAEIALP